MEIVANTMVSMHYTLTDDNGKVIDTSAGKSPLDFIQGQGMIVPGLDKAMLGHQKGDKFKVDVIPSEGYGEYNEELVRSLPRKAFQNEEISVGMVFYADTPNGPLPLTVSKVEGEEITVNMNHQLAGKTLHFEIEVVETRPVSEEEIEAAKHSCGDDCCCGNEDGGDDGECCGKHKDGNGDGECCGKHKDGNGGGECCGKHKNSSDDDSCCCKN